MNTSTMTREQYQAALDSGDFFQTRRAYHYAMKRMYDLRFRKDTQQLAREYLGPLTVKLYKLTETYISTSEG